MIHHILTSWFAFPDGGIWSNLVASALWVPVTYVSLLRHLHCRESGCFRPGTVPVKGTPHKVCKKHAGQGGHTH